MISKNIIRKSLDDAIVKCGYTLHDLFTDFNPKDFKQERYSRKDGQIRSADISPVGPLQQRQEDLQSKINYTNEEKSMLMDYSVDFWTYSAYFYHKGMFGDEWKLNCYKMDEKEWEKNSRRVLKEPNELVDFNIYDFDAMEEYRLKKGHDDYTPLPEYYIKKIPFEKGIKAFDNMIDKSPPLQENTVLYRVGSFDSNLKPGETGKWKSYTSTTFNSYQAKHGLKKHLGVAGKSSRYQIKIYAPKGTKGVVPCLNTGTRDWQSEFTLGRNQKYMVISVDHLNQTAEVLLY